QHSRLRLPASTLILIDVITDLDVVQRKLPAKFRVYALDNISGHPARADVRLIRHDDEQKPSFVKRTGAIDHARQQFKLGEARRGVRSAIADDRSVQHTVTIQKDCLDAPITARHPGFPISWPGSPAPDG